MFNKGKRLFLMGLTALFLISAVIPIGCGDSSSPSTQTPAAPTQQPAATQPSQPATPAVNPAPPSTNLKYQTIYTVTNKRFDGGTNYYVLLDPVNLSNDKITKDIKDLIKAIVQEKGGKISIDIFDSRNALDFHYNFWVQRAYNRAQTKEERSNLALHHIAGFSGQLSTDIYPNTLYFFPEADSSTPKVGKYVSVIEFNP